MKPLMPFVVALLSLSGATLRSQNISARTQLKLHAGRHNVLIDGRSDTELWPTGHPADGGRVTPTLCDGRM